MEIKCKKVIKYECGGDGKFFNTEKEAKYHHLKNKLQAKLNYAIGPMWVEFLCYGTAVSDVKEPVFSEILLKLLYTREAEKFLKELNEVFIEIKNNRELNE